MEDEDESGRVVAPGEWLAHEYTRRLLREAMKAQSNAGSNLTSACRSSTDPLVRQAHAELDGVCRMVNLLQGRMT